MQIEQLNHFVQAQRANQPSNNNSGEGNQNAVLDLQSENAAFIASLDSQLRAQTLM